MVSKPPENITLTPFERQIDFADEDPRIRALFEEDCAKRGVKSEMAPAARSSLSPWRPANPHSAEDS